MMLAMMLPGAAPMLLLFARVNRSHKAQDRPYVPTGIFAAGYLAAWGRFSLLAAALQSGLEQLDLLVPMMTTTNYWLGGAILLAAGLWQLTRSRASACATAARRWPCSRSSGGPASSEPSAWGSSTAPTASAAVGS